MKLLHTADMLGHPVRFFRSPMPGEDLPWHATDDLLKAMGLSRSLRLEYQTRIRSKWGRDVRPIESGGRSVLIAPHWMGQGITSAHDEISSGKGSSDDIDHPNGPWFSAYCKAAKEANDVLLLMLGVTPIDGVSRTIRAAMRVEGDGHVH